MSGQKPLRPRHGGAPLLGAGLLVACALCSFTASAQALGTAPSALPQAADAQPHSNPYPLSLGARGIMMPNAGFVGGLGLGLDASYSIVPNFAVGATVLSFFVDQGADPDYCGPCVTRGSSELLYGEGRLLPESLVTPYLRVEIGRAHLEGQRVAPQHYSENSATIGAELGAELHYKVLALRGFGFHLQPIASSLDSSELFGFGAQLGVRID